MATILVADDDASICRMVSLMLTDAGHDVVVVKDGRSALKELLTVAPAVMVTDIVMPEMEGIELIRHARRLAPALKVIAMSGGGKTMTKELVLYMAGSLGADAVLQKPFEATELVETVQRLLDSV